MPFGNGETLTQETIIIGSCQSTVFFPISSDTQTIFRKQKDTPMIVFFIIPGGFDAVDNGDQSLCVNFVKRLGVIGVATGHISAIQNGIGSMKAHCSSIFKVVSNLCDTTWKKEWGTDSRNVVMVASSFGAVLAMGLLDTFSVLALGLIVPLLDTNPGSKREPWGENANVLGLDTHLVLSSLDKTFEGVSREDWHNNPSMIPDTDRERLPQMCIAVACSDPLYGSGKEFADQQKLLGEHRVSFKAFNGPHKVKDQNTAEGHDLREYLVEYFHNLFATGNSIWQHWSEQPALLL